MEYYESLKIKEQWGDKPCQHEHLEKMYYSGAFLTVYVCSKCAREFTIAEKLQMDENARARAEIK
jgi:hypothetical protein